MDTRKLIEKKDPSAEAKGTQDIRSVETGKLVEMGPVSVETKGFFRGIEIGYTPRS
jgi:hypothetical protein